MLPCLFFESLCFEPLSVLKRGKVLATGFHRLRSVKLGFLSLRSFYSRQRIFPPRIFLAAARREEESNCRALKIIGSFL